MYRFVYFRAPWTSQHSLQIWSHILQLSCNLPMLALHCCKYYPMAKLRAMNWCCIMPCNVPVLAVECCKNRAILRQIQRSLEILTANDQHMVHRYFHTEVLSQRHVFTQAFTHTHAFTQGWFYAQIPSCAGVFTQGCFYTKKKLLHTNAWALLHADAFTQRCFYRGVLLHARAFTQSLFWHKLAFTLTEDFTLNTITQRCSSHRKTFVQRRLFRRIHFYKEDFCTDTFTERCFYTQVLLH